MGAALYALAEASTGARCRLSPAIGVNISGVSRRDAARDHRVRKPA